MSASTADDTTGRSGTGRVAQALLIARRGGPPADAAAMAALLQGPGDAYQVQQQVADGLGARPAGEMFWKSGGPSRDAVLTHAPLPPQGVWTSPANAREHPFRLRVIEAEIALRLGAEVSAARAASLTPADATSLVESMAVSIEIVDSRWAQGLQAPPLLKLADLQSHGALVLGAWRPYEARAWAEQSCTVAIGSGEPRVFRGTHSLGDPAWLLPTWLRHATRSGRPVRRGTVVTTGTWCGMLPAAPGDAVQVRFDGIGEAFVQL
ncbi:fumarylacetoacetate hydrolase family protein [Ramlibacter sp. Leaf400]|uniref:fumarylacetoacetate hydrolase family protein n=1 Tax=Ramlibacter sp. Leaf400 TaxID=1736365 RepID=UPI0006F43B88|nr:fumarylacetoacetate hydrolase family protein [Ramlibacter sp. Leaf400]KQT11415.1 2-keto-4-pentenoate hydratase [Ramlibacter sp. Leaf400]